MACGPPVHEALVPGGRWIDPVHGELLIGREQASSSDRLASQTVACNLPCHEALVLVRSWIGPLPRDPSPTRWSQSTCGRESSSPSAAPHRPLIQVLCSEPPTRAMAARRRVFNTPPPVMPGAYRRLAEAWLTRYVCLHGIVDASDPRRTRTAA